MSREGGGLVWAGQGDPPPHAALQLCSFWLLAFGFWVSGFWFLVLGFGFWVWGATCHLTFVHCLQYTGENISTVAALRAAAYLVIDGPRMQFFLGGAPHRRVSRH